MANPSAKPPHPYRRRLPFARAFSLLTAPPPFLSTFEKLTASATATVACFASDCRGATALRRWHPLCSTLLLLRPPEKAVDAIPGTTTTGLMERVIPLSFPGNGSYLHIMSDANPNNP